MPFAPCVALESPCQVLESRSPHPGGLTWPPPCMPLARVPSHLQPPRKVQHAAPAREHHQRDDDVVKLLDLGLWDGVGIRKGWGLGPRGCQGKLGRGEGDWGGRESVVSLPVSSTSDTAMSSNSCTWARGRQSASAGLEGGFGV